MVLFFEMLLHVPKDDCVIIINSLETNNCIAAIMNNNSNVSPLNIIRLGLWLIIGAFLVHFIECIKVFVIY